MPHQDVHIAFPARSFAADGFPKIVNKKMMHARCEDIADRTQQLARDNPAIGNTPWRLPAIVAGDYVPTVQRIDQPPVPEGRDRNIVITKAADPIAVNDLVPDFSGLLTLRQTPGEAKLPLRRQSESARVF